MTIARVREEVSSAACRDSSERRLRACGPTLCHRRCYLHRQQLHGYLAVRGHARRVPDRSPVLWSVPDIGRRDPRARILRHSSRRRRSAWCRRATCPTRFPWPRQRASRPRRPAPRRPGAPRGIRFPGSAMRRSPRVGPTKARVPSPRAWLPGAARVERLRAEEISRRALSRIRPSVPTPPHCDLSVCQS